LLLTTGSSSESGPGSQIFHRLTGSSTPSQTLNFARLWGLLWDRYFKLVKCPAYSLGFKAAYLRALGPRRSRVTVTMSRPIWIFTQPDLEAKLTQSAAQQGRHPDELVQDVLAQYFDEEARVVAAVKRGDASLRRGEYLTHEEVGERRKRFLQPS
jgi:predicted transcriptional regulator